jgi:hypothetical protein
MTVLPFDLYAECPPCGTRIKMRTLSGADQIEDVFDAVFEWMNRPNAREAVERRLEVLAEESDDL